MIEHIKWPVAKRGELTSPFRRGKEERPFRVTIHKESLLNLPQEEAESLEVLLDLINLPGFKILTTSGDAHPRMEIVSDYESPDLFLVGTMEQGSYTRYSYINNRKYLPQLAARIVGQEDILHAKSKAMYDSLMVALSHIAFSQDILITNSPELLDYRRTEQIREANPRRPSEAVKIVGLFLRSRDEYQYRNDYHELPRFHISRSAFYGAVTKQRMPSIWFYQNAISKSHLRNDTYRVAESAATRCARALEARDAIGELFYIPDMDSVADRMLYHFDYLALLLRGAFDAQALVAHRIYELPGSETSAAFQNKGYLKALRQKADQELVDLIEDQKLQAILTTLSLLRNTIHKARIVGFAGGSWANFNGATLQVPQSDNERFWSSIVCLGNTEQWGVNRQEYSDGSSDIYIEPYNFAVSSVALCINLINEIADKTDVSRVIPTTIPLSEIRSGPRLEGLSNPQTSRRMSISS